MLSQTESQCRLAVYAKHLRSISSRTSFEKAVLNSFSTRLAFEMASHGFLYAVSNIYPRPGIFRLSRNYRSFCFPLEGGKNDELSINRRKLTLDWSESYRLAAWAAKLNRFLGELDFL